MPAGTARGAARPAERGRNAPPLGTDASRGPAPAGRAERAALGIADTSALNIEGLCATGAAGGQLLLGLKAPKRASPATPAHDPETKRLAERAAALGFGSMADYITRLIREDAPKRLAEQALIQVSNEQFDHFLAACNDTSRMPSERLREAAARLDKEGY